MTLLVYSGGLSGAPLPLVSGARVGGCGRGGVIAAGEAHLTLTAYSVPTAIVAGGCPIGGLPVGLCVRAHIHTHTEVTSYNHSHHHNDTFCCIHGSHSTSPTSPTSPHISHFVLSNHVRSASTDTHTHIHIYAGIFFCLTQAACRWILQPLRLSMFSVDRGYLSCATSAHSWWSLVRK